MEKDSRFLEMFEFDLDNVEIYYAFLFKPDTKYESCWKATIILPDSLALEMKNLGFNVRDKKFGDETKQVIVAKRKTHTREGKAMYPPKVVDAGTADSDPQYWDENVGIGNGSVCNLKVAARYVDVGGKTRLPLYLNSVQVVEHKPYDSSPFKSVAQGGGNKL